MKYTLRPYQSDAAKAILEDIKTFDSCSAVLPTGSGKTLILVELIDKIRDRLPLDGMILVLCHLSDPLYQLYEAYCQFGDRPKRVIKWKGSMFSNSLSVDTVFASMQKMAKSEDFWRRRNKQKMVRHPSYIIIDEAHAYGAHSYNQIRKFFPNAKIIGLSATPYRNNKFSFSLFEKVSYTIAMGELIKLGYLVEPRLTQITLEDTSDAGRIAMCYKIWLEKEKPRGLPTIIYFPTTDHAKAAEAALSGKARVAYMDGSTSHGRVTQVVTSAKKGELDIIVNCQKLETGIDIPPIGSIMMPYKCGSVSRYIQRVGRGLRLYEGKTHCNVYLCGDSPSIEKGEWVKLHNDSLKVKETLPSDELIDGLEDIADRDFHLIKWTKEAIEACEKLESSDMITLANHLAKRRFPKKYDRHLQEIMHYAKTTSENKSPATEEQIFILKETLGFEDRAVRNLSQREADALLNGFRRWVHRDPWIIKRGPYIGKHPAEVPGLYKKHCNDPQVKATFYDWYRAGKPRLKDRHSEYNYFIPASDRKSLES